MGPKFGRTRSQQRLWKLGQVSQREDWCKRCRAFPERVRPWILSLQSIDYFGTSQYFNGWKKEESKRVNIHCMEMSLVMSSGFTFRQWLKWRAMLIDHISSKWFRLLDHQLKRAWKTKTKEILFPVGSHIVGKVKSSKTSEFKFPWIWGINVLWQIHFVGCI